MKIKKEWINESKINSKDYISLYKESIQDGEEFWNRQGNRIDWYEKYTKIKNTKYSNKDVSIKWYEDGRLNVSYNCVDRHAKENPNKIAIIWEGDEPGDTKKITYKELLLNVSKAANVLKKIGIKKGDRVTIYLTMIPELAYIMLACARIGAIHSIIFGGFSAESIAGRIQDCGSNYIITADEGVRGGKKIPLKNEKFNLEIFIGGGSSQSNYKYYNKDEQRIFAISNYKRKFNKSGEELPYRGGLMLTYKLSK